MSSDWLKNPNGGLAKARHFEEALGDPRVPNNPISFRSAIAKDEAEEYPAKDFQTLHKLGYLKTNVPRALGGEFDSFEEKLAISRVIARRDMSITHMSGATVLGSIPVWLAGSPEQKLRIAQIMLNGGGGALALTEERHGSDIKAIGTLAEETEGGYILNGAKWLINNPSKGATLCLLSRTRAKGQRDGFAIFMLVKDDLDPSSFEYLPKIQTHGMRAIDTSGVQFKNTFVAADSRLRGEDNGLYLMLKTLYCTRVMLSTVSLGAADTCMRATLEFAIDRVLYKSSILEIPAVKTQLLDSYLDLLIAECVCLIGTRSLQTLPGQLSVIGQVVKFLVPTLVDELIRELGVVLGARHYIRSGHYDGIFQKMIRDHAAIALVDGSVPINLNAISSQLPGLAIHRRLARGTSWLTDIERLGSLSYRPSSPGFLDSSELSISSRGQDDLMGYLKYEDPDDEDIDARDREIKELIAGFRRLLTELDSQLAMLEPAQLAEARTAQRFALARRYCLLHAAAGCALLWRKSRESVNDFFRDGDWLVLALKRLMHRLQPTALPPAWGELDERVFAHLMWQHEQDQMFSLLPLQLARRGSLAGGASKQPALGDLAR